MISDLRNSLVPDVLRETSAWNLFDWQKSCAISRYSEEKDTILKTPG